MTDIYRLKNQIKHYEWGSRGILPEFLSADNSDDSPWAEMWMGTNASAPSMIQNVCVNASRNSGVNEKIYLSEIEPLPFLFKALAVEKPLSIQAHPDRMQAEEGFRREEEAFLSLQSPLRNYKDKNHKPELICAVSPFTVMAGFRHPSNIRSAMEALFSHIPGLTEIFHVLSFSLEEPSSNSLRLFFNTLFNLSNDERRVLFSFLNEKSVREGVPSGIEPQQWKLVLDLAAQYPLDPAVLSPLYLNLFTLAPFQAVFIPAGILHAYVSGFGVELMANSDNVLRGGLTRKHIDIGELKKIIVFDPFMPQIYTPPPQAWFRYPSVCGEFSLSLLRGGEKIDFTESGSAVCLVTEGELRIEDTIFKKGESFFIPCEKKSKPVSFEGNYTLFAAAAGTAAGSA